MKLILTLIVFFASSFAFSQKIPLNKLWVGDANNHLEVDSDAMRVEYVLEYDGKKHLIKRAYRYLTISDTLRVVEHDFNGNKNHDFIIETLTTDELKLVSLDPDSRLLAFTEIPKKVLTFRSRQMISTDTIRLEKILFSSTTCYGVCPAMEFQIDNKKQMKFHGDNYAVKKGSCTAVLTDQLYDELLKILAVSELDKLIDPKQFNIDAPTFTLEVHYNNKVRFFKSAFFPYEANELLRFLLEIPKKVELKNAEPMKILFSQ
ncbi:DUF6438 domain-containing protein [Chitinophagaceae bacterium 26-R-25]|nr:DUF6438 domain-containing protein [Chitinophagaceae bacterium 26-R-25]